MCAAPERIRSPVRLFVKHRSWFQKGLSAKSAARMTSICRVRLFARPASSASDASSLLLKGKNAEFAEV
jgi:hypothetical protein